MSKPLYTENQIEEMDRSDSEARILKAHEIIRKTLSTTFLKEPLLFQSMTVADFSLSLIVASLSAAAAMDSPMKLIELLGASRYAFDLYEKTRVN